MQVGDTCWWYVWHVGKGLYVSIKFPPSSKRLCILTITGWRHKPSSLPHVNKGWGVCNKNNRLHLFPIYSSCVYGDMGVIQGRWKARGSQYNSVGWSFEGKTIWCMYLVCGSFLHALFLPRYNGSSRSFSTWYPETVPTNSFKTIEMRTKLSGSLTNKWK